jgi:hypothetical protein
MIRQAKETIREIIAKQNQTFMNTYGSNYSIQYAMDESTLSQYRFSTIDYRVRLKSYENKFICIMVVDNNTKQVLAFWNHFFLGIEDFKSTYFWKFEEGDNILKRISLMDIIPPDTKKAMTIGYTVLPNNFFAKVFIAKMFMKISRKLIKSDAFCYIETAGIGNVQLYPKKNILNIPIIEDVDLAILGITRQESKASEHFVKMNGFIELERIYEKGTLGKVFVKYDH